MGNKTVLVTGASRGIGKEIARSFAIEGYNVAIMCKSSINELNETLKELKELTPDVMALKYDLAKYENAEFAVRKILDEFENIDVLVNNAGVSYIGLFNTMKPNQWQNIMKNNMDTVFNTTHAVLQNMIKNHKGSIINISSMWGSIGASCEVAYSASKGAVNAFTKALAKEVAPSNIRVNAIACGAIDTSMNSFLNKEERKALEEEIPLGRFGTTEEVASMAMYLASDESRYITGQIIGVNGGMC
ncbi:MAG: elongation factor P 5-aminopentanone reductase [Lachnospirales bacterium]